MPLFAHYGRSIILRPLVPPPLVPRTSYVQAIAPDEPDRDDVVLELVGALADDHLVACEAPYACHGEGGLR
ncbi:hypothetical protein GCM10022233_29570 [Streptomyces shaanxiensis]|uniref:Uncharacterized protein n=1 Tax=Streptomyces shaanxiensis TaxID=653357 RepID=A0ABP7UYV2_9ACTN